MCIRDRFWTTINNYFPSNPQLFTSDILIQALPFALQLTLLAYLDSLLTSLVIDNMTKEKTRQDKELIAQGLANGLTAIAQGIPGAQATIRSVLLLKEGAKTRLAGVMVGVFAVSYTQLRAHETVLDLVCRLLLEKKKKNTT